MYQLTDLWVEEDPGLVSLVIEAETAFSRNNYKLATSLFLEALLDTLEFHPDMQLKTILYLNQRLESCYTKLGKEKIAGDYRAAAIEIKQHI